MVVLIVAYLVIVVLVFVCVAFTFSFLELGPQTFLFKYRLAMTNRLSLVQTGWFGFNKRNAEFVTLRWFNRCEVFIRLIFIIWERL